MSVSTGPYRRTNVVRTLAFLLVVLATAATATSAQTPVQMMQGDSGSESGGTSAEGTDGETPADTEGAQRPETDASVGPASPAGAFRAFVEAARGGEYSKAAEHLIIRSSGPAAPETDDPATLARRLKIVLDRELWVDIDRVSRSIEGNLEDGLPPDLERLGTIDGVDVLLRRVETDAGGKVWKFSAGTVARVDRLYEVYGDVRLDELLPHWMLDVRYLQIAVWQWIALVGLAIAAFLFGALAIAIVQLILRPIVRRTTTPLDDRILSQTRVPLIVVFAATAASPALTFVRLAEPPELTLSRILSAIAILAFLWAILRALDVFYDRAIEVFQTQGRRAAVSALPTIRRIAKVFVFLIAGIAILQSQGFNITGLLAGLGVGGLAVALAAQKTLANLFGGMSLLADQPVRVGDFCKFGDGKVGTVEEIGLRSTRIRTLDRTLLTIPNAEFSEMHLENFAARDKIRFHHIVNLRYETSPDQMRRVLIGLREMFYSHPRVESAPHPRVRFWQLGSASLDVEIFTYVVTTDWLDYLAVREDLLLEIMRVVHEAGTSFAFPSQTLYLGRDGGLDPERTERAENDVASWRDDGKLPFPNFTEDQVAKYHGSGHWPPRGSSNRHDDD